MKKYDDVPTPALIVEYPRLIRNIEYALELARKAGCNLRPHVKTHKCIPIADIQMKNGASGFCAATLAEVEMLVKNGAQDVFLAYPLTADAAVRKFVSLAKKAKLACSVDSASQADYLETSAEKLKTFINVMIEIDSGHHRCGIEPGPSLTDLVQYLVTKKNLRLNGVFTHAGHAYAAENMESLERIAVSESQSVMKAVTILELGGIACPVRSVGSTPTFPWIGQVKGITEVRPGNYVFFDRMQVALGVCKPEQCALSVLATVIASYDDRFVIDAGSKTVGLDKGAHGLDKIKGYGYFHDHPEWLLERLSEEHGIVSVPYNSQRPKIGEKVRFIPNHACAAVNLHSKYHVFDGEKLVDTWKISARR